MAIFGIGAFWDGKRDVSGEFLSRGVACVGWDDQDNPTAHAILRHLRTGDIIFIKSFSPAPGAGLTIKAVGVITEGKVREVPDLGYGVAVRWVWPGAVREERRLGKIADKNPVRTVTLYEEHNPGVQGTIIDLLLG